MSMVTIVMAAYNGEKYIGEQIESILSSTYRSFELLVFDDGSRDNTVSILREYEGRYPGMIRVIQNEKNLGVTLNFLQAICTTTTDYIMLCDQDDVWNTDKIALTLKKMKQMEDQEDRDIPVAVFTDTCVVDCERKTIHNSFFRNSHMDPNRTDLAHILMENKLIGCTVMINSALRSILREHRLPGKVRFHDWWIALIAASFGRIGYLNRATMQYRQHGSNVVGNQDFIAYIKNRLTSLRLQKANLIASQQQAEEFLNIYRERLSKDARITIHRFAELNNTGFVKRRYRIFRYGYCKTGLLRNLGLMIII